MSSYSFIAVDFEIPELDNPKARIITVKEAIEFGLKPPYPMTWESMNPDAKLLNFENESDLGELVITKGTPYEDIVRQHTDKPLIYSIGLVFSKSRVNRLLEYLKENIKEEKELELWSIWLNDEVIIQPILCDYEKISISDLTQIYDILDKKHEFNCCLIIKR